MNSAIDIIVTYVDNMQGDWLKEYNYYQNLEIKQGIQAATNAAAFDPARFRDWGLFKYWFRGIEKNCSWVHKVFLVVANKNQIPSWLDQSNEKLRIVTHEEFIPHDLLPTFNGPMIEMWYANIPDLSENFIACDDDYYFTNTIPSDWFFENNTPMTEFRLLPFYNLDKDIPIGNWQHMLKNSRLFIFRQTDCCMAYEYNHFPEPRKKSFEQQFIKEHYDFLYNSECVSRFRHNNNVMSSLYLDMMKVLNISRHKNTYSNSYLVCLHGNMASLHLLRHRQYQMLCINDSDVAQHTQDNIKILQEIFNNWLPDKSGFEK